ncbi:hypothetical protein [Sphingobacterium sp.]|uniref:hypothetical protein n=1 Tax=Sphingobacterium sp. TaxID=341027 RepID=UPI0028AAB304|nr:hypothetical protein [Sphingobacterium sp.]
MSEVKEIEMMIPTSLVNKLEKLFEEDKIDFNKILFTIYWINKGKYNSIKGKYENYQEVSSRFGNWISLVGKKGTNFINKLINGGIIKKVSGYVSAKHYTRYTLIEPFNYKGKSAKGNEFNYYQLTIDDGAFIRKYIMDGYNVIIPSNNNKKLEENKDKKYMELQDLYNELQKGFNQIQQENFELKAKIEELESNTEVAKPTTTRTEIASAVRTEMPTQHQPYNDEVINNMFQDAIKEFPVEVKQPMDYSQRATAYDSEIDKYIANNIKDVNHIYYNIKAKKIDCVPYPSTTKETICNGLWLAINYKVAENKKVA